VPVSLKGPVQRVELPLRVGEVRGVMQRLDVGHHVLVGGDRLGQVLLRHVDVVLALHEVGDVDRRYPEPWAPSVRR